RRLSHGAGLVQGRPDPLMNQITFSQSGSPFAQSTRSPRSVAEVQIAEMAPTHVIGPWTATGGVQLVPLPADSDHITWNLPPSGSPQPEVRSSDRRSSQTTAATRTRVADRSVIAGEKK